jgi:hypothetical protein
MDRFLHAIYCLLLLPLFIHTSCTDGARGERAIELPAAGAVRSAPLPALSELTGLPRSSSSLQTELLEDAPVAQSALGCDWQAGALALTPPTAESPAWAVFALTGLPTDGSAYPILLSVTAADGYWPAVADFGAGHWRFLNYASAGLYALDGGAALVSPSGSAYIALVAWQSPAAFTSLQLTTNQVPSTDPVLGINMEKVGSVSIGWTFVDVFKMSEPFTSTTPGGAPNPSPLDLDAQGWPRSLDSGQAATAVFLRGQQGYRDPGQYVLLFDGSGTIIAAADASIASQAPGRIVLDIDPGSNGDRSLIRITATDPADYVRNIRVVPLGHEGDYAAQLFSPEFLERLAPFALVRFLNWNNANNSLVANPADLTAPDYQTQGGPRGVAYEFMAELCNRLDADLWVNIPHLANDACVLQIAETLRDNLDPQRRVYIEHSNEIWSDGFSQGPWCEAEGLAQGLGPDPFSARIRFHSQRSVHIFGIFEQAFGGTSRLQRMLGAAHHDNFTVSEVLDWQDAYLHCDAVCTAPYIGGRLGRDPFAPQVRDMSVAEVVAEMQVDSVNSAAFTAAHAAVAQARGVDYVAYEGGQALFAQGAYVADTQLTSLFNTVNRDPAMRQLHVDHLTRWRDNGGGLFMAFNYIGRYDNFGNWGLLENQTQDVQSAYKYLGVLDYAGLSP